MGALSGLDEGLVDHSLALKSKKVCSAPEPTVQAHIGFSKQKSEETL